MSDRLIERLRHHAKDDRNTAFARSTMREAEQEIAAIRERFDKAAAAFEREQDRALAAEVRAETVETALSASREREARMRWQPIETAPKDGKVIVVRHNRGTWLYPKDQANICCVCVFWDGGRWNQFGPDSFNENTITHWMPLPAPPGTALAEVAQGKGNP